MKNLAKLDMDALDAEKTARVANIRAVEDEIDAIEAEMEGRRVAARTDTATAALTKALNDLPADARHAVISGATAALNNGANEGQV